MPAEAAVNATDRGVVIYDRLGQILPTQITVDGVVINNAAHSLDDIHVRIEWWSIGLSVVHFVILWHGNDAMFLQQG